MKRLKRVRPGLVHTTGAAALTLLVLGGCSGSDFTKAPSDGGDGGDVNSAGASISESGSGATEPRAGSSNLGEAGVAGAADDNSAGEASVGGSGGRGTVANHAGAGGKNSGGSGGANAGTGGKSSGGAGAAGKSGGGSGGNRADGGNGGNGGNGGRPALGAKAFSDFVASGEAWTVTGDLVTTMPTYSVLNGNPDGYIYATDGGTGTWFFTAPAKFYGDISAYAGGTLRFDLKVTAPDMPFDYADVQLTTAGLTLVYDLPNPTTSWKTYTVPLSATGWHVATFDGVAATAEQMATVLANLTRLRIRGEYNTGNDTGSLDNVYLGSKN